MTAVFGPKGTVGVSFVETPTSTTKKTTTTGATGGGTITPGKVSTQPSTGVLSAGGNLSLGQGPVAAQTPAQAFQSAIKNPAPLPENVSQAAAGVKAPVILKPDTVGVSGNGTGTMADAFKDALGQGKSMVDALVSQVATKESKAVSDYDLTEYIKKQSAAKVEAQLAGLAGAYEKAMAGYDAQAQKLPQSFDAARNKAAAQNAIATRAFQERAAASGLNSGTGGQADLARSAAYQAALVGIDTNQANAEAELELERANLTAEYQTAIAQAKATGNADLAEALYKELIRVQGLTREDAQTAYNREQDAYQKEQDALAWEYKLQQEADAKALNSATMLAGEGKFEALGAYYGWDANTIQWMNEQYQLAQYRAAMSEVVARAKEEADNLIKAGLMPDVATLEMAGYSTDYAQRLSKANADKLAGSTRGSSGRATNGGSNPTPAGQNWTDVESIYQLAKSQGGSDPESWIKMNYKALGIPYNSVTTVASGYRAWLGKQIEPVVNQVGQAVFDALKATLSGDKTFDALKSSVIYYINNGQDDKAGALVKQNAGALTDAQVDELTKIIGG